MDELKKLDYYDKKPKETETEIQKTEKLPELSVSLSDLAEKIELIDTFEMNEDDYFRLLNSIVYVIIDEISFLDHQRTFNDVQKLVSFAREYFNKGKESLAPANIAKFERLRKFFSSINPRKLETSLANAKNKFANLQLEIDGREVTVKDIS